MKIEDILAKMIKKEALTDEEAAFAKDWKPEEGKIPKARFDEVNTAKKAAEDEAKKLKEQIEELTGKVEELSNAGKTADQKAQDAVTKELNKLKRDLEAKTKEAEEATKAKSAMERKAAVSELAAKHKVIDSEYLDYMLNSKGVDLKDEKAVNSFAKELEKSSPHLFKSDAKGGSGTGGGAPTDVSGHQARMKELMSKKELSSREAGEVIDLQGKIKAAESESGKAKTGE